MRQVGDMKVYSFEEVKDDIIGKVGTPERDEYEREVQQALHACRIGEAIKVFHKKADNVQDILRNESKNYR